MFKQSQGNLYHYVLPDDLRAYLKAGTYRFYDERILRVENYVFKVGEDMSITYVADMKTLFGSKGIGQKFEDIVFIKIVENNKLYVSFKV